MKFNRSYITKVLATLTAVGLFTALSKVTAAIQDRAVHRHPTSFLTIENVDLLFPKNHVVTNNQNLGFYGAQINESIVKIFATPTGKNFCKSFSGNSGEIASTLLHGQNKSIANQIVTICNGHFAQSRYGLTFPSRLKTYSIVWTEDKDYPVNAWTDPDNQTFLVLNEEQQIEEQLLRVLAHELAVTLDGKGRFGYIGTLTLGDVLAANSASCDAAHLLGQPLVKHAFTALRALVLENQIITELGLKADRNIQQLLSGSCTEKLEKIWPAIARIAPALENDYFIGFDRPVCLPTSTLPELHSHSDTFKALSNLNLNLKDNSQVSACDFFSQPFPFVPGHNPRGGPSPRVGGGGGW